MYQVSCFWHGSFDSLWLSIKALSQMYAVTMQAEMEVAALHCAIFVFKRLPHSFENLHIQIQDG